MNPSTLGTALAAALFLTTSTPSARADVLTPDDTLHVEFTINNNWQGVTPDVITLGFGIIQVLSAFTSRTARIYDDCTLLGTDVKTSFGGYVGTLSLNPTNGFIDASSVWSFKNPAVIDFTSILDGSIQGRIEFKIATGAIDIPLNQVSLSMIHATSASGGSVTNPQPTVTHVSIDSTSVGTNFCISTVNSTGVESTIFASGSASVSANDLVLTAVDLPDQPGIFIAGPAMAQIPFFNGFLCVDSNGLQRFLNTAAPTAGVITEAVDIATSAAGGLNVASGSCYFYQRWNRDPAGGGGAANFSNGLRIAYVP